MELSRSLELSNLVRREWASESSHELRTRKELMRCGSAINRVFTGAAPSVEKSVVGMGVVALGVVALL